ncbi:unnamed protein product [Gongylonema pulchrum]|uniref:WD40/YVTN repeat-like-containing domain-containing protein n=1 Tax=Gongylonema pulchrum TaxID=637853 RepID=A0A183CWM8_9BILA|nr:unnamed protein product [Gongylonema pulchrum]
MVPIKDATDSDDEDDDDDDDDGDNNDDDEIYNHNITNYIDANGTGADNINSGYVNTIIMDYNNRIAISGANGVDCCAMFVFKDSILSNFASWNRN